MDANVAAIAGSIISGLVIELFFQLVKYKDSLNRNSPIGYAHLDVTSNYMTVSQYLSGGNRRWANYFLFRFIPPIVIFLLLAGVLREYSEIRDPLGYILLAATVSVISRNGRSLFTAKFISEKLLHGVTIVGVLILSICVGLIARSYDLSFIAPSISGLFDSLWSTLLVALLVVLYARITDMSSHYQDQRAEKNIYDNYVVKSYNKLSSEFSTLIESVCIQYSCSGPLLYAVLIYENMNRPSPLRHFENFIVRTTGLELTVGIAQVKSSTPLSDKESIRQAAQILQGSVFINNSYSAGRADVTQLETILVNYNESKRYANSVSSIMVTLRTYASNLYDLDH